MAKRTKITETLAQKLETTTIPEIVGVPEEEFKSAFENEEEGKKNIDPEPKTDKEPEDEIETPVVEEIKPEGKNSEFQDDWFNLINIMWG